MSTDLKVGDVVRLKSGGPRMTITKLCAPDVLVEWFPDIYATGLSVCKVPSEAVCKIEDKE